MSKLDFVIQKGNDSIEVDLLDRSVRIYVCEPHTCFGIDLNKTEVESLIDSLTAMKENME